MMCEQICTSYSCIKIWKVEWKRKNMKRYINPIFIVLTSILLLISSILVTKSNYYYNYLQISGYGLVIIYLAIRLIQKKPIRIIKNKLDICVIVLVISTIIPVLFNKYVSLSGSIATILEYIYVLSIYILIREITQDKKGLGRLIPNLLIISAIVLIFIGIDEITLKISQNFLKSIKVLSSENGDNRLMSTFGYPNVLATYIASILFLNIKQYLSNDKKSIKALYKTVTFIFTVGILLTYSKGIFLVLACAIPLYIVLLKSKKHKIEVIQNMIISIITGIMYINAFEYFFPLYYDKVIYILFGVMIVVNYLINIMVEYINTNIVNINFKKIFIFLLVTILICIIYVVIGLNIYDKYEVFKESIPSNYKVQVINNVKRKYWLYIGIWHWG